MGLFSFLHKKKDAAAAAPAPHAAPTASAPHVAPAPHVAAAPAAYVNTTGTLQVVIDGSPCKFTEGTPYVAGSDVMVPIRDLSNHLGATVGWDANTKTATLSKDGDKVEIVMDSKTAKVNGKDVALSAPPVVTDGRIFMPIKFLADSLEASYRYDAASKTAFIS